METTNISSFNPASDQNITNLFDYEMQQTKLDLIVRLGYEREPFDGNNLFGEQADQMLYAPPGPPTGGVVVVKDGGWVLAIGVFFYFVLKFMKNITSNRNKKIKRIHFKKMVTLMIGLLCVFSCWTVKAQISLSNEYFACPGSQVIIGMKTESGVDYYWYTSDTGGAPLRATPSDTITVFKTDTIPEVWYAERRTGSQPYQRYPITVYVGEKCGGGTSACEAGRLLASVDFGSYNDNNSFCTSTPLGTSITTYNFADVAYDGNYAICTYTGALSDYWYTVTPDHTTRDFYNGRYMIVNADYTPGTFYTIPIDGLCPGTKLYFSAWIGNLMNPNGKAFTSGSRNINEFSDPNLLFELKDAVTGTVLAQFTTGNIPKVNSKAEFWKQYGFTFTTESSSSVILTLKNNFKGGNGNDLGLDDIQIRLCVPPINVQSPMYTCPDKDFTFSVNFNDNNTFGSSMAAVLEYSSDNGNTWSMLHNSICTVSGNNPAKITCTIPGITSQHFTYQYRLGVANQDSYTDENCRSQSNPFLIKETPPLMYWTGAVDGNWNNPSNWTDGPDGTVSKTVPSSCTDVHIPGNLVNYSSLDEQTSPRDIYAKPTCNDIYFHFGGEVAKTQELTYHRAYVQYNFGYYDAANVYKTDGDKFSATPMARGRWYMLAAPLKKIVTGDLAVGGFPNLWHRSFKTASGYESKIVGEWYDAEANNAMELGAGQLYAVSIWAGEYLPGVIGENNHKDLNALKGVMQIPYFETSYSVNHHRDHNYDGIYSSFKYYYYDDPNLGFADENKYPPGKIARKEETYRFIFEDDFKNPYDPFRITVPVVDKNNDGQVDEVMVGNPFLSSLDFDLLYANNQDNMENYYKLYTSDSNYDTYIIGAGSQFLTKLVAPYQAIIIKPKGSIGSSTTLNFGKNTSVTRTGSTPLRSSQCTASRYPENVIYIQASNAEGYSNITLSFADIVEKNVNRLFSDDNPGVPQLYVPDEKQGKYDVFFVDKQVREIPLGIQSHSDGEIQLQFYNLERFSAGSIVLEDKYSGKEYDLFTDPVYTFKSIPQYNENRFLLKIGDIASGIGFEKLSGLELNVYMQDKVLYVSAGDLISDITISNIEGRRVLYIAKVGKSRVESPLNFNRGLYLVSVKLRSGKIKTEKLVVY